MCKIPTTHPYVDIYMTYIVLYSRSQPRVMFTPVSYTLATEEAERIGVDHIARSSVAGTTLTSAGIDPRCNIRSLLCCLSPYPPHPTPSLSQFLSSSVHSMEQSRCSILVSDSYSTISKPFKLVQLYT